VVVATCPHCREEWPLRVPNPIRCPRCGNKL
jgi:exosome complex RNA-binding protein Csl4